MCLNLVRRLVDSRDEACRVVASERRPMTSLHLTSQGSIRASSRACCPNHPDAPGARTAESARFGLDGNSCLWTSISSRGHGCPRSGQFGEHALTSAPTGDFKTVNAYAFIRELEKLHHFLQKETGETKNGKNFVSFVGFCWSFKIRQQPPSRTVYRPSLPSMYRSFLSTNRATAFRIRLRGEG
jgi:hypothetical protein